MARYLQAARAARASAATEAHVASRSRGEMGRASVNCDPSYFLTRFGLLLESTLHFVRQLFALAWCCVSQEDKGTAVLRHFLLFSLVSFYDALCPVRSLRAGVCMGMFGAVTCNVRTSTCKERGNEDSVKRAAVLECPKQAHAGVEVTIFCGCWVYFRLTQPLAGVQMLTNADQNSQLTCCSRVCCASTGRTLAEIEEKGWTPTRAAHVSAVAYMWQRKDVEGVLKVLYS